MPAVRVVSVIEGLDQGCGQRRATKTCTCRSRAWGAMQLSYACLAVACMLAAALVVDAQGGSCMVELCCMRVV